MALLEYPLHQEYSWCTYTNSEDQLFLCPLFVRKALGLEMPAPSPRRLLLRLANRPFRGSRQVRVRRRNWMNTAWWWQAPALFGDRAWSDTYSALSQGLDQLFPRIRNKRTLCRVYFQIVPQKN